jgi:putative hemolysin
MPWEILLILVLILANGLFAGAEIAIIAARRGRLEQRAAEGSRGAQWALDLSRNPDIFLPTVQVGITLVGAFAAAYGGQQLVDDLSSLVARLPWAWMRRHADAVALAIFVVCYTYASLILGELVPKRISLNRAEGLAVFVAPIMKFIAGVAKPLVWFMGVSTNAVLWSLRLAGSPEPSVSLDDI